MLRSATLSLLVTCLARPAEAQVPIPRVRVEGNATWAISQEYRAVQRRAVEMQRRTLLALADSMPERLYRDRLTPVQRDFAQQIAHAAGEAYRIGAVVMGLEQVPNLPDTLTAFTSRVGLDSYINVAYDHVGKWLDTQSDAERRQVIDFFGDRVARWMVWDEISAYTIWTAAQLVGNFRRNGMAPPAFSYFKGEKVDVTPF
jgi:hypothetical protein